MELVQEDVERNPADDFACPTSFAICLLLFTSPVIFAAIVTYLALTICALPLLLLLLCLYDRGVLWRTWNTGAVLFSGFVVSMTYCCPCCCILCIVAVCEEDD